MKQAWVKAFAFFCMGFAVGITAYHTRIDNVADEIDKLTSTDFSTESLSYLSIATAIRNRKYDEALKFTEDMLTISINSFTGNGNATNSLDSHEKSAIDKVKRYRERECKNGCLSNLSWIESYSEGE